MSLPLSPSSPQLCMYLLDHGDPPPHLRLVAFRAFVVLPVADAAHDVTPGSAALQDGVAAPRDLQTHNALDQFLHFSPHRRLHLRLLGEEVDGSFSVAVSLKFEPTRLVLRPNLIRDPQIRIESHFFKDSGLIRIFFSRFKSGIRQRFT